MLDTVATQAKPQAPVQPERIPLHFELDEKLIDTAIIRQPTFASFCGCIAGAHAMTTPAAFAARLLRVRDEQPCLLSPQRRNRAVSTP